MSQPERDQGIEALFGTLSVRSYRATADESLIDALRDSERVGTNAMSTGRHSEFATARACARAALADLGIDAAIPRGERGAPVWPAGTTGSISHTRGFCLAVAAESKAVLGLDVEEIARIRPNIERRILVASEQERAASLAADDRAREVAAIFAAKEAFYKAHHQIEPRYLGFDVVEVILDGDRVGFAPGSGQVRPELIHAASGHLKIVDGRVIVGVVIDA